MLRLPLSNQIAEINEITIKLLNDYIEETFQKSWNKIIVRVNRRLGPSYMIINDTSIEVMLVNGEERAMSLNTNTIDLGRCFIRIGKRSRSENIEIVITKPSYVNIIEHSPPIKKNVMIL